MNSIYRPLIALAVALVGWVSVAPWIEAVATSTKVGYAIYCPLIALAVWFFLLVGLRIRRRASGARYALLGVLWLLGGWIPTYFLAIALTSGLVVAASRYAYLAFVPVGLPVAEICAASAAASSLAFAAMLLFDVTKRLLPRTGY